MVVLGQFFLGEGALALGYAALRAFCASRLALVDAPRVLRQRIVVGNQLMPGLCWLGLLALSIGLVLVVCGGAISE